MKKLTTKWFKKWSRKVKLSNQDLLDTINDLESGLSTSDLGGNLYKVRVKREHTGKSSGFRTIVIFKSKRTAIFVYGFGKNEKDNIDKNVLDYLKKLGKDLLSLNSNEIKLAIKKGVLNDLEETQ